MSDSNLALPLSGVKVVTLEQAVAAPFCSRQLADLGADVIKVERPGSGDFARSYEGSLNGLSGHFAWLNRGKRSVVLDLKQAEDRATLGKLLARADVFIHNLAPGAVERLGFGYEALQAEQPRLIWCGISGYGSDGPFRDKKAYDLLVQAEAGVVSLTGSPDAPAKVGVSVADIAAGLYSYASIMAALLNRARTGRGERIDISMLECLVEWAMPSLYMWHGTGQMPERVGVRHNMIVPYGAYACADGSVNFAIQNQREWGRFCRLVLERPELVDDGRFATNARRLANRVELETLVEQVFASLTAREIIRRLEAAEIANGAVNDMAAVINHAQLAARERWTEVASPNGLIKAMLPPHNLSSAPPHMGAVPALGEHTRQVLAELREDA
ncbi:MAG TPA: CaiB/BaiF CoA-transferase family protein [Anaerolineae bacterium]|jgi:crotonobetainyl-CoA:carnitine CoA-transferase CaiB-like acyl-CoA transferase